MTHTSSSPSHSYTWQNAFTLVLKLRHCTCNLANSSPLAVNKVPSILSDVFLLVWLVEGSCEAGGDPLSLCSLSKTNGSECWRNQPHNISSDASIFWGCHRWVSVTAGNNWVFTRRHFECVLKYQQSLGIGWNFYHTIDKCCSFIFPFLTPFDCRILVSGFDLVYVTAH